MYIFILGKDYIYIMKASIIITAYNIEEYVERCIVSAINQSEKDIEIIIVNDGSTDGTLEILNRYSYLDKRVKIVNKNNEGISKARYDGFKISKGEFVIFVDGDDWIELDTIEKLYCTAKDNYSDIVICNFCFAYENGNISRGELRESNYVDMIFDKMLIGQATPYLWNKFIKRDFIVKNNIKFDENLNYAEDLLLLIKFYILNPKISIYNGHLYNYYQRKNSITKSTNKKVLDVIISIEKIKNILKESRIYELKVKELEMCIFLNFFIFIVINKEEANEYTEKIYREFKSNKILLYKNNYIKDYIDKYSFLGKLRIRIYYHSYLLGKAYDYFRRNLKGL